MLLSYTKTLHMALEEFFQTNDVDSLRAARRVFKNLTQADDIPGGGCFFDIIISELEKGEGGQELGEGEES